MVLEPIRRFTVGKLRRGLTPGLLALTVSIYALVIVGAVTSMADAAATCTTWPTCDGSVLPTISDPAVMVAMGHWFLTIIVFALLIGVTVLAWVVDAPTIVKIALGATLLLFPIQIGIGAMTVIVGPAEWFPGLHLLMAMAIFAGSLLALVYWLEWETREVSSSFDDSPSREEAEVTPTVDGPIDVVRAYVQMTKPRLMWLLCIVALAGLGLATAATGVQLTWTVALGTLLGGVLAIGASGTFNHVLERDIDRSMARTSDRPLPQAVVPPRHALVFGGLLTVASIGTFLLTTNALAAGLGLVAIGFYSVVYTLVLKPNTTQNIVIGGAVGAFPAIIGWAAATGSIGIPAIVLGLVIFLWTPAHFYNLALVYKRDYERGGFPMLPIVRGEAVTRRHIVYYAGATLLSVGVLGAIGGLGFLYALTAIVAGGGFLIAIAHLYRQQTPTAAMRTFHASNAFLGVLMLVIIVETLLI